MNREEYQAYVDHFNNKRYDAVTGYFTPDITVEYFTNLSNPKEPPRTLHGPKEFMASYMALHDHVREILELRDFMTQGDLLFAELYTEFHCFKDYGATSFNPLKKGDISIMTNWVMYNMTPDDKMKRIRIAHFRMHDPTTAKFVGR
jgi:hypothetical protein